MEQTSSVSLPVSTPPPAEPRLQLQDKSLVDRITYLASLASDRQSIDPMLDALRAITARWYSNQIMAQDRVELEKIESDLKSYLINDDPLRAFTSKTLEERLAAQARRDRQDTTTRDVCLVVVAGIVAAAVTALAPILGLPSARRLLLAIPIFLMVFIAGIIWFFMSSLKNFKQELRRTFVVLSISTVLMWIAATHFAAIQLFNLGDVPALEYGGITALGTLPFLVLYLSLRMYANLLGIKTRFASVRFLAAVTAPLVILAVTLPHPTPVPSELFFRISIAFVPCTATVVIFGAFLGHKIKRAVTPAYAGSIRLLAYYFTFLAVSVPPSVIYFFSAGVFKGQTLYTILAANQILPAALLLYAAYLFKRNTSK